MTGFEMGWLRKQLNNNGYRAVRFSYRMLSRDLDHNIEKLRQAILAERGPVHLLGHSLGGVMALQTLRKHPELNVDKVICMGSPLAGTQAGSNFARFNFGNFMLGKTLPEAVFNKPIKAWRGKQLVGSIAGSFSVGVGQLVAKLRKPHDGMIEARETKLPGLKDFVLLPVNHTGMLMSDRVVDQVDFFFRFGRFDHQHSTVFAGAAGDRSAKAHQDHDHVS